MAAAAIAYARARKRQHARQAPGSATQLQAGAVVSAAAPVVDVVVAQPLPVDAVVLEAKS